MDADRPKKATPAKKASPAKRAAAPAKKTPVKKAALPPDQVPAKKTPARKAAPAKKAQATPAKKAQAPTPAKKAPPGPATPAPAPAPAPAPETFAVAKQPVPRTREDLWPRVRADPGFAPELLAEAAVDAYGPQARAWADRMRLVYPAATPAALARLATAEHVRLSATTGALASLANPLAPLAGVGALAGLQARLVLRIAAAYGVDPAAPERAVDLLVLTRVHPDAETAREALAAAAKPTQPNRQHGHGQHRGTLLRALTFWLGQRALARLVPGAAVALGATAGAGATQALAGRAVQLYR